MLSEERKKKILEMVESNGIVTINELTDMFSVSVYTIRRDLSDLQQKGLIRKTHGGAIKVEKVMWLPTVEEGAQEVSREKDSIARKASVYVEDGDTVFFIGGTISLMMVPYIKDRRFTAFTNSIDEAKALCRYDNIETIVIGGRVKNGKGNILGSRATFELNDFHFDKSFIPCGGIEHRSGVTTSAMDSADFARAVISSASENILVADYRKIGRVTFARICGFEGIRRLITDGKADRGELEKISEKNIRIDIADDN